MLKEVYIIKNDVKVYHYSEFKERDETHFILSSGFFSAIKMFTLEMRSSKIDFFASENEYFIFDRIEEFDTDVVCIFNNSIEQSVARIIIKGIVDILANTPFLDSPRGKNITGKDHKSLTKKIEHLANSLILPEYQSKAADSVFNEIDELKYLALYDVLRNETHYSNVRDIKIDEDMLKDIIVDLYQNMNRLLGRLGFGNNFEVILIESFDYFGLIYNFRGNLIICNVSDKFDIKDLYVIPHKILSISTSMTIEEKYGNLFNESRWIYDVMGILTPIRGVVANNVNEEDMHQTIISLNKLTEVLQLDYYHSTKVFSDKPGVSYLQFMRNNTTSEHIINLFY